VGNRDAPRAARGGHLTHSSPTRPYLLCSPGETTGKSGKLCLMSLSSLISHGGWAATTDKPTSDKKSTRAWRRPDGVISSRIWAGDAVAINEHEQVQTRTELARNALYQSA
jgi:hypothetical protein